MNVLVSGFDVPQLLGDEKLFAIPDAVDGQVHVSDANLVFSGEYSRSGPDLHVVGNDGLHLVVPGYFASDSHVSLVSPDGAVLTGDVVARLVGPQFAGQYAGQTAPISGSTIGRVESLAGTVTATRVDGSAVELKVGDVVHEGDVISTAPASSVGLTFADQTVLSLSESSRLVLDQYSYSAEGTAQSSNSMLVNVIEGTFVFIAGLIAPSGKMRVETPVASMGIRGTTGIVEIEAKDGATGFKLISDPDGGVGHFDLFNKKSGDFIRAFTEAGDSLLVRNAGGETSDISAALDASQKSAVGQAFTAYSLGQARIERGEDPVGNPSGPNGAPPTPPPGAPRRGEIDSLPRYAGLMAQQPLIDLLKEVTFEPEDSEQIFLLTDSEKPPLHNVEIITSAAEAVVIEAGLPGTGSNPATDSATFTGAITSTGGQGAYAYEIVGSATGIYGTIEINGDGTYTYTLTSPVDDVGGNDGANTQAAAEVFTYRATDANGNTVTGTIVVNITDDVPIARPDTAIATEGGIVAGNVLTDGTADVFGADGPAAAGGVVGVRAAVGNLTDAVLTGLGQQINGQFGQLILNADGSYSYDGFANAVLPDGATDVFVYTISDGDGDLVTTTLTINVTDSGLAAVTDSDAQVSEAALTTGSNPSSPAETDANNTLTGSVTGGAGPYTYALVDSNTGAATGLYGTITLNAATGEYSYTLTTPVSNTGANAGSATDSFTYRATDANGNTVTGTIVVNITDDVPIARPDTNSGDEATLDNKSVNIVIVFDRSGSMGQDPNTDGFDTRIDLARAAVANLLSTLQASAAAVNVLVVDFAGDARTSGWTTIDGANSYLNALTAGGGTDYDVALQRTQTAFLSSTPTAEQNITVFLSDGVPTTGGGIDAISTGAQVSQAEWEAFLTAQDMPSFAIGIGSGVDTSSLQPIAFDPASGVQSADTPVVYGTGSEGELLDALSNLVVSSFPNSFSGNLLLGNNGTAGGGDDDAFGADGPAVQRIIATALVSITGSDATFEVASSTTATGDLRLIGSDDGRDVWRLDVNTATGEYTLTLLADFPHAISGGDAILSFAYTIRDGDGDLSTSNLTITVGDVTGGDSIASARAIDATAIEGVAFFDSTGHVVGAEGTAVIHAGETARFDLQGASSSSDLSFGAFAVSQQLIAAQDQPITMTIAAIDAQGGIITNLTVKAFSIVGGIWTDQTNITTSANGDGTVTVSSLETGFHLSIESDVAFHALEFSNGSETVNSNEGFKFTDITIDRFGGPADSSGSDTLNVSSANLGEVIDGGAGQDTLRLIEPNFVLDFESLAANTIRSIEAIDLTGNSVQELRLSLGDVVDLSETANLDLVNAAGSKGIELSQSENVLIAADSSDHISLLAQSGADGEAWVKAEGGPVSVGNHDFDVYNYVSGSHILASVAVDSDASVQTAAVS